MSTTQFIETHINQLKGIQFFRSDLQSQIINSKINNIMEYKFNNTNLIGSRAANLDNNYLSTDAFKRLVKERFLQSEGYNDRVADFGLSKQLEFNLNDSSSRDKLIEDAIDLFLNSNCDTYTVDATLADNIRSIFHSILISLSSNNLLLFPNPESIELDEILAGKVIYLTNESFLVIHLHTDSALDLKASPELISTQVLTFDPVFIGDPANLLIDRTRLAISEHIEELVSNQANPLIETGLNYIQYMTECSDLTNSIQFLDLLYNLVSQFNVFI